MSGIGYRPAGTSAGKVAWLTTTVISLGLGIALSDGSPANAQGAAPSAESSTHLDEMVVTARRRAEKLQQVPVAITAVSGDTLRVQGVHDFYDLARTAPGFTSNQGTRGTYVPSYAIRGQRGPQTQTILLDPAVLISFADLSLSRSMGTNQSMYDLQSLQILKGPQGTLFGRNATGGVVLIEPNKPTDQFGGYIQGSLGNFNLRDVEAMVNVPVGEKVAIRVAGKYTKRDGYLTSAIGQKLDDIDAVSARVSVRLRPTDSIDSTFIGTFFDGRGAGSGLKIFTVQPQVLSAAVRPYVGAIELADLAATNAGPKYGTTTRVAQHVGDTVRSIQNNTTIDLGTTFAGHIVLKNVAGYRSLLDGYDGLGVNGSSVDVFRYTDSRAVARQASEEFQIQGDTDKMDYVLGAFYIDEWGYDKYTQNIGNYIFSPELAAVTPPAVLTALRNALPSIGRNLAEAENESYAGFLHVNRKLPWLLDGLSISGGVRMTHDTRSVTWHNISSSGVIPRAGGVVNPPIPSYLCVVKGTVISQPDPNLCVLSGTVSKSVITYDMGLDWRVNPDLMVYLVSRRGYRTGGFNNTPPNIGSLVGASFDPEYNRDVEIGEKADFNVGNVVGRLNTAVFYEWYNNIQRTVAGLNQDGTVSGRVTNAARAHIYGGEVELTVKPTSNFQLTAGYAIIQPQYDTWFDRVNVPGAGLTNVDVSDAKLGLVPYTQWAVTATYTVPVPAQWGTPSLTVNWTGQSGVASLDPDTHNCGPLGLDLNCYNNAGRYPGYNLINMRADWRDLAESGLDIGIFVTNVTNQYYYNGGVNSIGSGLGYASAAIGPPRMYGVEVRYSFGATGN